MTKEEKEIAIKQLEFVLAGIRRVNILLARAENAAFEDKP